MPRRPDASRDRLRHRAICGPGFRRDDGAGAYSTLSSVGGFGCFSLNFLRYAAAAFG
jgi:hypothetical protein